MRNHGIRYYIKYCIGDSCAEVGMTVQCCTESDDTCHSLNSTCFCDPYCFKRGDCCEDIFSKSNYIML